MTTKLCVCGDPNCTIPYGLCHCPCGLPTNIAKKDRPEAGYMKGEPAPFLRGHTRTSYRARARRREVVQPNDSSLRTIALTRGKTTIISAHRYDEFAKWNWSAVQPTPGGQFYAARHRAKHEPAGPECVYMHVAIVNPCAGMFADHKNGNGLDNRDENLREVTRVQQQQNLKLFVNNKSGVKGVRWVESRKRWVARIRANNVSIQLGYFKTKEEAVAARLAAEVKYFGEYRRK